MSFSKHSWWSAILACLGVLGLASMARAQNRPVNPSTAPQAPPQTSAGSGAIAPPGGGFVPPPSYAYPPPYQILSPAGSYLSGASDVINAQGQYIISYRQSQIVREQAEQAKLDTRRKTIDQWQYEQSIQPSLADVRAKQRMDTYSVMRGTPPDARVWNGDALNSLLENVQTPQSASTRKPSIPLDPELLSRIKFTDGRNKGDVTLFAQGPKIDWPFALQGQEFKQNRAKVESLSAAVVRQAQAGDVDVGTIKSIQGITLAMQADLKSQVEELTPSDYMTAKAFLNDLYKGARGLAEPNASAALSRSKPQVSTVDQLVAMMTRQGLRFAPAKDGDEAAYTSLYQSLRAYDAGTSQMVAQSPPRPIGRQ